MSQSSADTRSRRLSAVWLVFAVLVLLTLTLVNVTDWNWNVTIPGLHRHCAEFGTSDEACPMDERL